MPTKTTSKPAPSGQCENCGTRHRTLTSEECIDRSMTEKTLSDRILYRARKHKWKSAHSAKVETEQGWRTAMAVGWPDYVFAKSGHRLIFMEVKTELGLADPEQWIWLDLLNECGAKAIIVRPSDLRTGRIDAIFRVGSPL